MNSVVSLSDHFKHDFRKLRKRHRSLDGELENLIADLHADPFMGTYIGGNMRKIRLRIASKGKGKSGGARVITHTVIVAATEANVKLLTIYDKADRESISETTLREILREEGLS